MDTLDRTNTVEYVPSSNRILSLTDFSGTRAADMAVRLKYAGVAPERVVVEPDLARALDDALAQLPASATLHALPTYTAMLDLRAELARRGWVRPFWED